MSIEFEKPTKQRDHIKLLELAVQMITKAVGSDMIGTAFAAEKLFKAATGKDTETQANRNWVWVTQTLAEATRAVLQHPRLHCELTETELTPRLMALIKTVPDQGQIEPVHLMNPTVHPAFAMAKTQIVDIVRGACPEHGFSDAVITQKFHRALMVAGTTVAAAHPDYFEGLNQALSAPTAIPQKRAHAHARHARFISRMFVSDPIFSPDEDETVSLSEVYIHLRSYWHHRVEDKDDNVTITTHLGDLHETVAQWLQAPEDPLRLIAGGPGSGKSSFAKAFAHQMIQEESHRVVFVELQHFTFETNTYDALSTYVRRSNNNTEPDGSAGFYENPLDWAADDDTPVLLIFDGLDELSADDTEARSLTKQFVEGVNNLLGQQRMANKKVKALVLGRSTACQDALDAGQREKLLHVAPIRPLQASDLGVPHEGDKQNEDKYWDDSNIEHKLEDPLGILGKEQRIGYWRRWKNASNRKEDTPPESLTHEDMSELNVEPLLLHLLLISDFATIHWREAAANRNLVYDDILTKIFERNKTKPPLSKSDLSKEDFFRLMECLSLSAWRGGGRTGTEEEFKPLRDAYRDGRKWENITQLPVADLKSIALQIHTRRDSDRQGFEFIHKSIGEYLTGRALFETAVDLADELEHRMKEAEAAEKWIELFSHRPVTEPILRFLKDEVRRYPHPEKLRGGLDRLTAVFDHTLRKGFPRLDEHYTLSYRELELRQRYAESSLLTVLSCMAQGIAPDAGQGEIDRTMRVNIDWPELHSASQLFNRLVDNYDDSLPKEYARLNLDGALLYGLQMNHYNFDGSSFVKADLRFATLLQVSLQNCDLQGAEFRGAMVALASFDQSNLSKSGFQNTLLDNTIFKNCDFEDAEFSRTMVEGANYSSAKNMTVEQLNQCIGSKYTKLPADIETSQITWADKEE
ncbi:pentapeptide repeat-containing protein [Ascidiaceihabitans sp.]|uniref:pentapeptide repeat-containing protein n=1 Tax=Ascidiaceihabitans sp. TaxID=1872644 RepID=UPI00329A34B1